MIAGHFGFAAVVKSRVPEARTWALMLASVGLDLIFTPLFLTGVETMEPFGGGDGKAYGGAVIHADWTHSLVGALVISALVGVACAWPWGKKIGAVIGGVVFSHWVLDLPMHHHDMPLLPGHTGELGFGLWSFPVASAALELALVVAGAWLYGRAARATGAERPARITSLVLLACGVVTLALNLAGV